MRSSTCLFKVAHIGVTDRSDILITAAFILPQDRFRHATNCPIGRSTLCRVVLWSNNLLCVKTLAKLNYQMPAVYDIVSTV